MSGKAEGDCFKFERDCSRSLFKLNKYSKEAQSTKHNEIQLDHVLSPKFLNGAM